MCDKQACNCCVLHSKIPGVVIDESGECNVCKDFTKNSKLRKISSKFLTYKLNELIKDVKSRKNMYDAIVLFSGGKDSTYLLKTVKDVYGLHPLALSIVHPLSKEAAKNNIDETVKKMNVEIIKYYIDEQDYKTVMKYAIENMKRYDLGEFTGCAICSFFFKYLAILLAIKLDIPIVFDGIDINQSDSQVFYDGYIMKENAKKGILPLGDAHRLFKDALGESYEGSIYDFSYERYKEYDFPSLVAPFTFVEYDYREKVKELEMLEFNQNNYKSLLTNCDAIPFFSYFTIKNFDCVSYIKQYASEIRNGYPALLSLKYNSVEEKTEISKELIKSLLEEYTNVCVYVAENRIDQTNITEQDKEKIMRLASTFSKIYGKEEMAVFFENVLKTVSFAEYFNVSLDT